ncbi:hypothetical protein ACFX13_032564 [Malus domestica]
MGKEKTTDLEFEARKEKKKLKEKRKTDEPGRNSASIEGLEDKISEAVQVEKFDKNGESGEGVKKKKKRKREMEGFDGGLKLKQNDVQQLGNDKEKSNEFDKNVGTDKESGEGSGGTDRESGEGAKKKNKRKKETNGVNSELKLNQSDEQLLGNDREKSNEFDKNVGTDKESGEGNGGTDRESGEGAKKKKKRKKETEGVNSELMSNQSDEQLLGNDREKSNGKIMEEADIADNEKKRKKLSEDDEMGDAKMNKGELNKKKKRKKKEKTEMVGGESVQNIVTDGKEAGVESKHSDEQIMEKGGIMKKEKTKNSKNSRSEVQETGGEKLGSKSRTQENNSLENDGNVHGTGDEISNRNTEDENSTQKETSKRVHFADDIEVFSLSDGSKDAEVGKVRGKRFSAEEDELVKKAVLTYIEEHQLGDEGIDMVLNCKNYPEIRNCWKDIGETLPWRDKKSIYYRAHMLLERASERTWTKEEYEKVRRAANEAKEKGEAKPNWRKVGNELGKHRIHVKDAWRRIKLQNMKTGVWSQEEYQTLFDLVNKDLRMRALEEKKYSKHGMLRDNIKWEAISETLGTRTNPVCCQKWYNQLASPLVADGQWADVDDYRLVYALDSLDACCMEEVDWDDLLEHRSGDVCKKRWNQMVRHIGQYAMKSFAEQVEILSKRYCPDALEAKEACDSKPIVE